jgi:hypothetical protein
MAVPCWSIRLNFYSNLGQRKKQGRDFSEKKETAGAAAF